MANRAGRPLTLALALSFILSVVSTSQAQYFGQNKVQYKEFKFEVLKTDHFDVYFYPEERENAERVGRMAERWNTRLSEIFNHDLHGRQPIVLYASNPDFHQTNVVAGIGEGTGGVTEGLKRRVVLPLAGTLRETDHVLGHELVHAFQYDIADSNADGGMRAESIPLWFIEGMAEYLSIGPIDSHTAMWIRDAARGPQRGSAGDASKDTMPTISDLGNPKYFPYRWGQALWAYVGGRWGDETIGRAYHEAVRAGDAEVALKSITGLSQKELSAEWHAAIHAQYDSILKTAHRAETFGRPVTAADKAETAMNVSPVLSPDGSRIIYLSARDMLSIDLFLADAATGRVLRRLTDSALDPHITSLQFIGSAGSWRPNGREFVIGAVREGRPELAILDVDRGEIAREIPFPALGEILNPSWSPDGRFIAFSATTGGNSDLYVYDLGAQASLDQARDDPEALEGSLRQLTQDAFADLQPNWSPDGRRLAFVTDRFSTRLENLEAGAYQLALFDVQSGAIASLRTFGEGKSINPQWAADGRRLFFLSDASGITNVHQLDLSSGAITQVTDLDAGVSGITALSPALSSSLDSKGLAFSAYEDGRHHIYVIDDPSQPRIPASAGGRSWSRVSAAGLPPADREAGQVVRLLEDPTLGLPAESGSVEPYRTRLSLNSAGQSFISAGVDRFGALVGGGLSFGWSDMLGNHNLGATISTDTYGSGGLSGILKNTGGILAYQNTTRRLNWGIAVDQIPYLSGGYSTGLGTANGERTSVQRTIIQRQVNRGVTGGVAYPLSRATRIEFGGGYQHVGFDQEVRTISTSLRTGRLISDQTTSTALADSLHLNSFSAATVYDNAIFGATSPIAGGRSRLELSPTFGSLSYTSALADFRRYLMPARFYTLAGRLLHYGRYGGASEDSRLMPLYLGYPEFVRGYGIGSFRSNECSASGNCETVDRLIGSRMLVSNLEFRFPLLRPFGVSDKMYGPLPLEVAFFADAGVAWNGGQRPSLLGGDRKGVTSAGMSVRSNLLGFAVAQIDLAYPFARQGRGWVWGFSLTPGF
jgi:Tol biopolymer transport system component